MRSLFNRLGVVVLMAFALAAVLPHAHAQDLSKPLLVMATAKLDNGPYAKAVMAATPFKGGHVGVVLNKPGKAKLGQLFPSHEASKAVVEPAYRGGLEYQNAVVMIAHSAEQPSAQSLELAPGHWLVFDAATIDAFLGKSPNAQRYYIGFVMWREGLLAEEVAKRQVSVRAMDEAKLFAPDTSRLYEELAPAGGARLYDI